MAEGRRGSFPQTLRVGDVVPLATFNGGARCIEQTTARTVWCGEQDGTIRVRAFPSGAEVRAIGAPRKAHCNALTKVGAGVWAGLSDGFIVVIDAESGEKVQEMVQHDGAVLCLAQGAGCVFSGGADWKVRQWNADTREHMRMFSGHSNAVRCIVVHVSGACTTVYSASDDATVKAWDIAPPGLVKDSGCRFTFRGHHRAVLSLALERSQLWSGSDDGSIRVWSTESMECIAVLEGHSAPVISLVSVEARLWSAAKDGKIYVWDTATLTPLRQINEQANRRFPTVLKRLSRRAQWQLWCGMSDGVVQSWSVDCATSEELDFDTDLWLASADEFRRIIAEKDKAILELCRKTDHADAALAHEVSTLRRANVSLQETISELQTRCHMAEELAHASRSIRRSSSERAVIVAQPPRSSRMLEDETSLLRAKVAALQQECDRKNRDLQCMTDQLAAAEEQVEAMVRHADGSRAEFDAHLAMCEQQHLQDEKARALSDRAAAEMRQEIVRLRAEIEHATEAQATRDASFSPAPRAVFLETEVLELQRSLDNFAAENRRLEASLTERNNELTILAAELQRCKEFQISLSDHRELQEEVAALRVTVEEQRQSIHINLQQSEEQQQILCASERQIGNLEAQLNLAQQEAETERLSVESLQSQIQVLQSQQQSKSPEIKKRDNLISDLQVAQQTLQRKYDDTVAQLASITKKSESRAVEDKKYAQTLQVQLKAAHEKIADLEISLQEAPMRRLSGRHLSLTSPRGAPRTPDFGRASPTDSTDRPSVEERVRLLEEKLRETEAQRDRAKRAISIMSVKQARSERPLADRTLSDLSTSELSVTESGGCASCEVLETQLTACRSSIRALEISLEAAEVERQEIQSQLVQAQAGDSPIPKPKLAAPLPTVVRRSSLRGSGCQATMTDADDTPAVSASLEKRVDLLLYECAERQSQVDALQKAVRENTEALQSSDTAIKRHEAELAARQKTIEGLRMELAHTSQAVTEVASLKLAKAESEKQLAALKKENVNLSTLVHTHEAKCSALSNTVRNLEERIAMADGMSTSFDEQRQRLLALENENTRLRLNSAIAEKQIESLKQQLAAVSNAPSSKDEIRRLESVIEERDALLSNRTQLEGILRDIKSCDDALLTSVGLEPTKSTATSPSTSPVITQLEYRQLRERISILERSLRPPSRGRTSPRSPERSDPPTPKLSGGVDDAGYAAHLGKLLEDVHATNRRLRSEMESQQKVIARMKEKLDALQAFALSRREGGSTNAEDDVAILRHAIDERGAELFAENTALRAILAERGGARDDRPPSPFADTSERDDWDRTELRDAQRQISQLHHILAIILAQKTTPTGAGGDGVEREVAMRQQQRTIDELRATIDRLEATVAAGHGSDGESGDASYFLTALKHERDLRFVNETLLRDARVTAETYVREIAQLRSEAIARAADVATEAHWRVQSDVDIQRLRGRELSLTQSLDDAHAENARMIEKISQLQQTCGNHEGEVWMCQQALARHGIVADDDRPVVALCRALDRAMADVDALRLRVETLSTELDDAIAFGEEADANLSDASRRLQRMEADIQSERSRARSHVEVLNDKIRRAEGEAQALTQQRMVQSAETVGAYEAAMEAKEKFMATSAVKVSAVQDRVDSLTKLNEKLRAENDSMRQAIEVKDTQIEAMRAAAVSQIDVQGSSEAMYSEQQASLERSIESLKAALAEERRRTQLAVQEGTQKFVTSEQRATIAEEQLRRALKDLESACESRNSLEMERISLGKRLAVQQGSNATLQRSLEESQRELQETSEELHAYKDLAAALGIDSFDGEVIQEAALFIAECSSANSDLMVVLQKVQSVLPSSGRLPPPSPRNGSNPVANLLHCVRFTIDQLYALITVVEEADRHHIDTRRKLVSFAERNKQLSEELNIAHVTSDERHEVYTKDLERSRGDALLIAQRLLDAMTDVMRRLNLLSSPVRQIRDTWPELYARLVEHLNPVIDVLKGTHHEAHAAIAQCCAEIDGTLQEDAGDEGDACTDVEEDDDPHPRVDPPVVASLSRDDEDRLRDALRAHRRQAPVGGRR